MRAGQSAHVGAVSVGHCRVRSVDVTSDRVVIVWTASAHGALERTHDMRIISIGMLLAFLATPSLAEDAGSTMAALKDQPSECRYYKTLCDDYLTEMDKVTAANSEAQSLLNAGDRRGAATRNAEAGVYIGAASNAWREVQSAGKVLKAKHDAVPACFSECPQRR